MTEEQAWVLIGIIFLVGVVIDYRLRDVVRELKAMRAGVPREGR